MNINDIQEVYALVGVKEETSSEGNSKIYGYVACEAYLIGENIDSNGNKKYKIVYKKNVDNLTLDTYTSLEPQTPIFNSKGECTNFIEVDNIYNELYIATDAREEENIKFFKKLADDKYINSSNYGGKILTLHDLKRAIDDEKARLLDRTEDLNAIEKYINGRNKMM